MGNRRLLACEGDETPVEAPLTRIEQIRAQALELFARRGFGQVSMRELGLHVGIGAGSLYHHFASKEQLLFELIEELYEDLLEAVVMTATGSPTSSLRALLHAHIDLHEQRRLHFLMAEQESRCLSAEYQQQVRQMRASYEDKFLLRLQAAGATAPMPMLKATVKGLVAWLNSLPGWSEDCALPAEQKRALIIAMAQGALSGVLKPSQPSLDSAIVVPLRPAGAASQD